QAKIATPFEGLSEKLLTQHFELYKGYVANANTLLEEIETKKITGPSLADRRRRLGFELNGIFLHELYFENITPKNTTPSAETKDALGKAFGGFEKFIEELKDTAKTRGVGWAVVSYDKILGRVHVGWQEEHHFGGAFVGVPPVLVVDCWEHAYITDYGATGRGSYVEAVVKRIDWNVVGERLIRAK
ncbi:MAG: putative Superoxide dismutase, partial [Streblomastix strix]